MDPEFIAALNRLASAHERIADGLNRLADQLTHRDETSPESIPSAIDHLSREIANAGLEIREAVESRQEPESE